MINIKTVFRLGVMAVAFFGFGLALETLMGYGQSSIAAEVGDVGIKPNFVCMINDEYMAKEQIPVPVGDKIYYGCCQGCVVALQSNQNNIRYARDPYSGKEVDKAEAFIVKKTPELQQVYYFESKENYYQFLNKAK